MTGLAEKVFYLNIKQMEKKMKEAIKLLPDDVPRMAIEWRVYRGLQSRTSKRLKIDAKSLESPEAVAQFKEAVRKEIEDLQGDSMKQIIQEEIQKRIKDAKELGMKDIELQTAAKQSLKEMLVRRKQLKRSQIKSPTDKRQAEIAELDLAIAQSDEVLSLDDAYGLMAD